MEDQEYAGFWIRVFAAIIDTILIILITAPFMMMFGLSNIDEPLSTIDIVINLLFVVATIIFWIVKGATPGKMITKIKIVDVETGNNPSLGQSVIRYIGYIIATVPLLLGLIWVGIDKKKQGWHDKMANTIVIKND